MVRRCSSAVQQSILRDLMEDTGLEGAQLAWQVPHRWLSSGSGVLPEIEVTFELDALGVLKSRSGASTCQFQGQA